MVLLDERPGEGQHHRLEGVGGDLAGLLRLLAGPPGREPDAVAGGEHRRPALAERLEVAVEHALARDVAVAEQADLLERRGDDRPGAAAQQRAVEIEERGCPAPSAIGSGR